MLQRAPIGVNVRPDAIKQLEEMIYDRVMEYVAETRNTFSPKAILSLEGRGDFTEADVNDGPKLTAFTKETGRDVLYVWREIVVLCQAPLYCYAFVMHVISRGVVQPDYIYRKTEVKFVLGNLVPEMAE